ncbi:FtsX-like permease family protein [Ornithobacterium rhinotracheale]|uniref:ABC transporter permease n=1 Tax=Ornithobacterium rhinotracheale TaxID=28251 RepID=UPI001FF276CB|nr:FtsX-like permease family protein [Ornithobacterium rhinotracheale]MCK0202252.1 FtsX-like permease family protein [Ornithobacterium rhinotracheale]
MNWFPIKLASRYIFSGKNAIEVNVISWIAFLALGFVTTCLIVILSVFSGLEDINVQFYSNINPDIKVEPSQGKSFKISPETLQKIQETQGVKTICPVVEERAFAEFLGKKHIVTVKGIDERFNSIFGLDSMVLYGQPLDFKELDYINIGTNVSTRLSLFPDTENAVKLLVPKPGEGLITNPDEAFNHVEAYATGIFRINDKYSDFIFMNLPLAQKLLDYAPNQYSALEITTDGNNQSIQNALKKELGDKFQVLTRKELNAAFMKMINTENLVIYLIFILILCIASFNLAGSVAILILNKRSQSETLRCLGLSQKNLKKSFFYTGLLISLYALGFGLILGTILLLLQKYYGLVYISDFLAFPVKLTWENYFISIFSVLFIGSVVSYFVSRKV